MNQYKGEAWLGEEPQIREETITETVSADIIVVGGRQAGGGDGTKGSSL